MEFDNVKKWYIPEGEVARVVDSLNRVIWEKNKYFYVEDISGSANTLSIKKNNANAPTVEVFKSTDSVNWESMGTTDTTAITATVPANGRLYLKATTDRWGNTSSTYNYIKCDGNFNVGGNIMSLLYGDNFEDKTSFSYGTTSNYVLENLFSDNATLISADKLLLPATTLAISCYAGMFRNCTSLAQAPELPATSTNSYCYSAMFGGCTSLTQAPALPATTLYDNCYYYMFSGCTSLTQAPALPATTLAVNCYWGMFHNCHNLTTAPALPAKSIARYCYQDMFSGCTSLTAAPALPATTLSEHCYSNMFQGCTSLTQVPALPSYNLTKYCYMAMFQGCTALTTAPELPAVNVNIYSYAQMFSGCTALTTAPELPVKNLQNYCYYEMFKGCRNLNSVTSYAANISATDCLTNWLSGVSSTGDFYNLGGATYPSGSSGIPSGWTKHTSL